MYPEAFHAGIMGGKALPYDREVEYIGSTDAGQYIDTGLVVGAKFEMDVYFSISNNNAGIQICGCWNPNNNRFYFGYLVAKDIRFVNGDEAVLYRMTLALNTKYHAIIRKEGGNGGEFEGTLFSGYSALQASYLRSNIYLFGSGNYTSSGERAKWINLHGITISDWSSGEKVKMRDYVSVVKDDVGYMYDRCGSICQLTGTPLYSNAGTGNFVIGPDKT